MRGPRATVIVAALFMLTACTAREDGMVDVPSAAPQVPPSPSVVAPATTLASGEALPAGCDRGTPDPRQVVSFVAEGRAWALDLDGARLTCLFKVRDPGPFAWGPQGDRVLLGDLAVRGVEPEAPTFPAADVSPVAFDWGHPIGLAVVFAGSGDRTPQKRFMDDGRVEPLPSLPGGRYLDVAYHPSGLALAFVIDRQGEQSIWLSTNEGTDPVRLVFSKGGTRFTSIAFTPDGERLVWTAQHAGGYPQIHTMALDDRTGFTDGWRGEPEQQVSNLQLAPRGRLMAIDEGAGCDDRSATIVLSPRVAASGPARERRAQHDHRMARPLDAARGRRRMPGAPGPRGRRRGRRSDPARARGRGRRDPHRDDIGAGLRSCTTERGRRGAAPRRRGLIAPRGRPVGRLGGR